MLLLLHSTRRCFAYSTVNDLRLVSVCASSVMMKIEPLRSFWLVKFRENTKHSKLLGTRCDDSRPISVFSIIFNPSCICCNYFVLSEPSEARKPLGVRINLSRYNSRSRVAIIIKVKSGFSTKHTKIISRERAMNIHENKKSEEQAIIMERNHVVIL